jgi:nucleotide-binding universal stress UspA family protein
MARALHRIAVATDFSAGSARAAERAGLLARASSALVEVLHVLPPAGRLNAWLGPSEDETTVFERASTRLAAQVQSLRTDGGVQAGGRVVPGPRTAALAKACEDADLLVVAAPRPKAWFDPRPGWLHRLLRSTRVPVLIVREPAAAPYRRAVAAVDLVTPHAAALAVARSIAPRARIDVIHAYRSPFEGRMQYAGVAAAAIAEHRADALQAVAYRLADAMFAHAPHPQLTARVVHGNAATGVLDEARDLRAELVVVCRSARPLLEQWLVPGVTARLLDEGTADLLVVPP